MRRISAVLLVTFFIFSCISAYAQRRSASHLIGTVDFRAVIMLHPGMGNYDAGRQAFKADGSAATAAQTESRRKSHQERIEELSSQARRLQANITAHHRLYEREMTTLSNAYLDKMRQNLATAAAAVVSQTYNVQRQLAETQHRSRLRATGDQLAAVSDQLAKLQKLSYHAGLTDPEETKKRFQALVSEAKQLVQQVAVQKGIEIVLNSSYKRAFSFSESTARKLFVPSGLAYGDILNTPYNPDDERKKDINSFIAGYYANISDLTRDWLKYESSVLSQFTADFVDSDIIMGGVDLTADVLAALFKRYRINENIGRAVIQAATAK